MTNDQDLKFAHMVEARANALSDDMRQALEDARASILGKLARLQDRLLDGDFSEASATQRAALLQAQAEEIGAILGPVFTDMGTQLQDAAVDVMQATGLATTAGLNAALGTAVSFTGLPRTALKAWEGMSQVEGLLVNEWLRKLQASTVERVVSAGRQALVEGLGVRATAALMRQKGIEGSVPGMEGLARTWLHSAASYAREEVVQAHFRDDVRGWQYFATLDGRTCPVCGADDGKTFALDAAKPTLPRHWRCRCIYTPISRTWRELGIDADEAPESERPAVKHDARTVHHRDGSTSTAFRVREVEHTTETYSQWLTRQLDEDPAFVRQILGKTRFELFKTGKLNLTKMSTGYRVRKLSQ